LYTLLGYSYANIKHKNRAGFEGALAIFETDQRLTAALHYQFQEEKTAQQIASCLAAWDCVQSAPTWPLQPGLQQRDILHPLDVQWLPQDSRHFEGQEQHP